MEKDITCRFNAPWAPSNKPRIVCSEKKIDKTMAKHNKNLIEKVLSYVAINDLFGVIQSEI